MSKESKKLTGVTKTGFTYTISKNNLDNYELFELMSEVDENPTVFPKIADLVLGKNQMKELKEHLRREDGTVSTEKIMTEIKNILTDNPLTKK